MRILLLTALLIACSPFAGLAQKKQQRAAWRALSDYEETVKEGRPNESFLAQAKEAIDQAAAHPDTRYQNKTLAYKFRIYYGLYRNQLDKATQALQDSVGDKDERLVTAYGRTPLSNFDIAAQALDTLREKDPAYLDKVNEAAKTGVSALDEDDSRFALAVQQFRLESANIASGKYRAKQYGVAADYFYKTAVIKTVLTKTKDTNDFYNACVAASRSKDTERIKKYNKAMIDAAVSTSYNYESLYNVQIAAGDSAEALEILKKGRALFPADAALLTQETNYYLASGRHDEALKNLLEASANEPSNSLYHFVIGNIYDNLANPKEKANGNDLPKPDRFAEYFAKAEEHYQKAIDLNPANQEYLYNALYNLGAMYNNYGGYLAVSKVSNTKEQKEIDRRAQEYYKKAIPYLERALSLRQGDKPTMAALRKLYLLTRDDAKAKQMGDRLKATN